MKTAGGKRERENRIWLGVLEKLPIGILRGKKGRRGEKEKSLVV